MHLLIDRGSLGHEEEAIIATTLVEDLDSLGGHFLETGKVKSGLATARGVVLEGLKVVLVHVAVEPGRQITSSKDTESLLAGVSAEEAGLVEADGVALLSKLLVVVLALVGGRAGNVLGEEVLRTGTEVHIGAVLLGPAVVGHAVESLVNQGTVLATKTGVAGESSGSGISEVGSGDGTPSTTVNTTEDLDNGLDLGVIKGVLGGIGVHAEEEFLSV